MTCSLLPPLLKILPELYHIAIILPSIKQQYGLQKNLMVKHENIGIHYKIPLKQLVK